MTTFAVPRTTPRNPIGVRSPLTLAAVLGPLLFLAGQALLPALPDRLAGALPLMFEHRDQLMAARLLTAAGAFLLAFAAVRYVALVPEGRGARIMRVGAVAFGVASFCNALSQAVSGYATWTVTAPGFDRDAAGYVVEHIESGLVAIPLGFWSIPVFALGSLLMAAGMWRSHAVPAWLPTLLAIGTVLAGAFAGRGPVVALTQAPFTAALVAMAVLRRDGDGG